MARGWWDRERGESSPCFPGAPAEEQKDSQGCLGTVGAARVGAQGEGGEFLKNSINQTKALGAGRGSSSRQVLPASRPPGTEQKCPILSVTNLLMEFFNTGFILYFFLLVLSDTVLELDIDEARWVGHPPLSPG